MHTVGNVDWVWSLFVDVGVCRLLWIGKASDKVLDQRISVTIVTATTRFYCSIIAMAITLTNLKDEKMSEKNTSLFVWCYCNEIIPKTAVGLKGVCCKEGGGAKVNQEICTSNTQTPSSGILSKMMQQC